MIFYGKNSISEALKSSYNIRKIFIDESFHGSSFFNEKLQSHKQILTITDRKELSKIANTEDHRGIVADVDFSVKNLDKLGSEMMNEGSQNYLYIYDATYEHNIGAIIRTAECAGFSGVVIPTAVNISAVAANSSAGAIFHIPIYKAAVFNAIKLFKKNDFAISVIERGGTNLFETNFFDKNLLIIGGEDKAMPEKIFSLCDSLVSIPQFGKINSLNMSVAASLAMYEVVRKAGKKI